MRYFLQFDVEKFNRKEKIHAAFLVMAGLREFSEVDMFGFLDNWPIPQGVGQPLAEIFANIADLYPDSLHVRLLRKLYSDQDSEHLEALIAFRVLASKNITLFTTADFRRAYQLMQDENKKDKEKRKACVVLIGLAALLDQDLAAEWFSEVLTTAGIHLRRAAPNSLRYCATSQPGFVLAQGKCVISIIKDPTNIGVLDNYLACLTEIPVNEGWEVLTRLEDWFPAERLDKLRAKETTLGKLLIALKVFSRSSPETAFRIATRCPVETRGVAGSLGALYMNLAGATDDPTVLSDILDDCPKLIAFADQEQLRHALPLLLATIDNKLMDGRVKNMVFQKYEALIKKEGVLNILVRAATKLPSWTVKDTDRLLGNKSLPDSTKGLLLKHRVA